MGYNTRYGLTWKPEAPEVEIYLAANSDTYYGIDEHGDGTEECKWYEHEEDMVRLSKLFPNITFVLSGEGEEQPDAWQKKFIAGEQWTSRACLVFTAFEKGQGSNRNAQIEWPE